MSKLIRHRTGVTPTLPPERLRPVHDASELLTLLRAKLYEETAEVVRSSTIVEGLNDRDRLVVAREGLADELADLIEVIGTIAEVQGVGKAAVMDAIEAKNLRRGGLLPGLVYT